MYDQPLIGHHKEFSLFFFFLRGEGLSKGFQLEWRAGGRSSLDHSGNGLVAG